MALWLAALTCVGVADEALAQGRPGTVSGASVQVPAALAQVLRRVNAFRHEHDRDRLTPDARLDAAAQEFAIYMARTDRFSHEVDGTGPPDRARKHGYDYCMVSENIGYEQRHSGFSGEELARLLVEGWKDSPPHRHNLLDPDVVDSGLGLAQSAATGRWYAVQMFGKPESARVAFEVANPAAVTVHYRLGEERFELRPGVTRTHEQCRAVALALEGTGKETGAGVKPRTGDHYIVVRDGTGSSRLERK